MAKQSSVNLDITNNADGFDISGGTVLRKLSITGGDITVAGSGSATLTFPTTTTTIAGTGITQSFTVLQTFNAGLSASGATFSGNIFAPNIVNSVNGSTGAIVSVAVTGSNTFTGLQTMNAGLTANNLYVSQGVTFNSTSVHTGLATFNAGVTANNLWVTNGATFASRAAFTQGFTASNVFVNGGATFAGANTVAFTVGLTSPYVYVGEVLSDTISPRTNGSALYLNTVGNNTTYIGDYSGAGNSTYIEVDDTTHTIGLNGTISSINAVGGVQGNSILSNTTITYGPGSASIDSVSTALTTTASNQTVWDVYVGDATQIPYSSYYRSMEFMIQAATGTTFEAMKMLVTHDDTNTWNTQYGVIRNGLTMGSYNTTLVDNLGGKYLRLRVSPTYRGTKFKVAGTILTA